MGLRYSTIALLVLLVFSNKSSGQILIIDKSDTMPYAKKPTFNLLVATALEVDQQKSLVVDASNVIETSLQKNKSLWIFSGGYRTTYNGNDDILNVGYVHLRFRYGYRNPIHTESFVQYQWDDIRGIEYRKLIGFNLRYNNYVHPKINLVFGLGLMAESEKWDYRGVVNQEDFRPETVETNYLKTNSYLKFEVKTSENSDLYFTTFYQFRPDSEWRKFRLATSLKWAVAISRRVQMNTGINTVYDPNPIVPIRKFYFNLLNGLTIKI